MIATDAGGIHALRYGSMRRQVVGIEAVLADGTVVRQRAGGTAPAGVDLVSLLSGSEGTLAVISGARLRLVPVLPERATALVALDDVAAAVAATAHAGARIPDLEAAELVDAASLALTASRAGQPLPFDGPVSSLKRPRPGRRWTISPMRCNPCPGCATPCCRGWAGTAPLWALREAVTEAISSVGIPHKLDVELPLGRLATFVDALEPTVAGVDGDARVFVFGHLALGNLHVNVTGPGPRMSASTTPSCAWSSTTAARSRPNTASVGRRRAGSGSRGRPKSWRFMPQSSGRWIRTGSSTVACWMARSGEVN